MIRLRVILLFLLLGAVVNVVVAWGIAWWGDSAVGMRNPTKGGFTFRTGSRPFPRPIDNAATDWALYRIEKPGTSLVIMAAVTQPILGYEPFQNLLPPVAALQQQLLDFESAFPPDAQWSDMPGIFYWDGRGWPMISMACYWPWFKSGYSPSTWPAPPIVGGIDFGSPTAQHPWPYGACDLRGIPYLPVWPGFNFLTASKSSQCTRLPKPAFSIRPLRRTREPLL